MPFTGFIIAAAGNLKRPYTHDNLEALVNMHGGEFSENCDFDCDVTHLVCSQAAYQAKTQKVKSVIAKGSVKIVDISWIEACLKHKEALPEANYLLGKKKSPAVGVDSDSDNKSEIDSDSNSARETTSDRVQIQPNRIYAFGPGDNKGTGISGALEAKQIIRLDPKGISEMIRYVYMSEGKTYEISLVRCNVSKEEATNELMNLQIVKTDIGPHVQYVLCTCGRTLPHKSQVIYGVPNPGSENTLDVLINVYQSELEKRTAQGYLLVDFDKSIDIDLEAAPSEQTLKARDALYSLLKLVLPNPELINPKEMKAKSAEYDKLIFKNLSKTSIKSGEEILAKLEKIIANSSDKQKATGESKSDVFKLTSQYYSSIPHSYSLDLGLGINGPVVLLDSHEKIRKELDMLGSLEEIIMSTALARKINLTDNGHDKTLNEHFKTLSLKNIDVVGRDLQEFKLIERYFVNTGGLTGIPASWTLQIFRIERFGDEERWNSAGWNKMAKDEDGRYLLWYGTPLDNMGTILKEGLKNEFERGGIFFSDTAETSLDYSQQFGGFKDEIVTMLLCEVQLGHIPYNRTGGSSIGKIGSQLGRMDYDWTDAGSINQNLEGVRMPDVEYTNSCLYERVEYVARHGPSQIKHRYIVLCRPRI